MRLLGRCGEDVFEWLECFGEVFGFGGRDDFDVGEAEEGEDLAAARGGRGEDYSFGAQVVEEREAEGWWAWEGGACCCWWWWCCCCC